MLPAPFEHTLLKSSYCNLVQKGSGLLEQVVEREGLALPDVGCLGRAGRRLARSLALARWLRTRQDAPAD